MPGPDYSLDHFRKYLEEKRAELHQARRRGIPHLNRWLMDYGNSLGVFPGQWKQEAHRVPGCSGQVFVVATLANGRLFYIGHADSRLTRGQLALLINGLNGLTPAEITPGAEKLLQEFAGDSEVRFSMTVSRTNSLGTLFNFMKRQAENFAVTTPD